MTALAQEPAGIEAILDRALWLAGFGHFALLAASFQVPARLGWREDVAKLRPFNRKLFWTYGAFTALTIVAFGTLTLILHDELLRGERAALGLAAFIGFFWTARLAVDFLYFSHAEWPQGRRFLVGHGLLVLLFLFLAATYFALLAWHVWLR